MNTQEYIKNRLDNQIEWYNQKSQFNKSRYKLAKLLIIIISVSIPFLAGLVSEEREWVKIVLAVCGLIIAFLEGVNNLNKYHDNWINYRQSAELLEREKLLFLTKAGPYREKNALQDLVERVEHFTQQENQHWIQFNQQKKEEQS